MGLRRRVSCAWVREVGNDEVKPFFHHRCLSTYYRPRQWLRSCTCTWSATTPHCIYSRCPRYLNLFIVIYSLHSSHHKRGSIDQIVPHSKLVQMRWPSLFCSDSRPCLLFLKLLTSSASASCFVDVEGGECRLRCFRLMGRGRGTQINSKQQTFWFGKRVWGMAIGSSKLLPVCWCRSCGCALLCWRVMIFGFG